MSLTISRRAAARAAIVKGDFRAESSRKMASATEI